MVLTKERSSVSLQTMDTVYAIEVIFEYLRLEFQRILHSPPLYLMLLHSIPPFVSICRGSV
ncbi:MAG: hypothetical protein WBJ46_02325, partial [Rectinema sp.]